MSNLIKFSISTTRVLANLAQRNIRFSYLRYFCVVSPFTSSTLRSSQRGFTLIEIMVVFALTAVMAGGGLFAFAKYARTQELSRAKEEIRLTYEQARNYALSNVKPETICLPANKLRGYRINLQNDRITLVMHCTIGNTTTAVTANTSTVIRLPNRVRLRNVGGGAPTNCTGVEFQVITGNVIGPIPCEDEVQIFHQDISGSAENMNISQDGRISFEAP